jgi:hypothetical protein
MCPKQIGGNAVRAEVGRTDARQDRTEQPLSAWMAAWASWSLPISTKPKPFERPVSRSMMTWASPSPV